MSKTEPKAFKVVSNVPVPEFDGRGRGSIRYPWHTMKVKDSFVVEADKAEIAGRKLINSVRASASRFGKAHNMKFKAFQIDGGLRIWRTE